MILKKLKKKIMKRLIKILKVEKNLFKCFTKNHRVKIYNINEKK